MGWAKGELKKRICEFLDLLIMKKLKSYQLPPNWRISYWEYSHQMLWKKNQLLLERLAKDKLLGIFYIGDVRLDNVRIIPIFWSKIADSSAFRMYLFADFFQKSYAGVCQRRSTFGFKYVRECERALEMKIVFSTKGIKWYYVLNLEECAMYSLEQMFISFAKGFVTFSCWR